MVERRHPDAECENCPMFDLGNYASEVGAATNQTLVIGEQPGPMEAELGQSFTGPAAKLIGRVLEHHKFRWGNVRFINVVACAFPYRPGKQPDTPKEAIRCCSKRLPNEIKGKTQVLLLGNTPKEAVLGVKTPITKLRQAPPRDLDAYPGVKFVPTVHPYACLLSSDMFPSLVKDVGKLRNSAIYVKWEPPVYKSFEDPTEAGMVMQHIANMPERLMALDIETDVEKDMAFTHPKGILSVGLGHEPGKAVVIGEEALQNPGVLDDLQKLVEAKDVVCHNGKYDLQVLMRMGVLTQPDLFADTMLASYALDERPGQHGLKGIASEVLGAPDYGADVSKYLGPNDSYAVIPRPALYKYNAFDAALTYDLWNHFSAKLKGQRRVHDMLVGFSDALTYVELEGVRVDVPYLDTLTEEYLISLKEVEAALKPWVNNPRSHVQVKAALKELGHPVLSSAQDILQDLLLMDISDACRDFVTLLLHQRKEQKMYGTYVKGIRSRMIDQRVYPTYMIHGTVFGRLACRNPNMHNIPRLSKLKKEFIPGEGNTIVQTDFSQAELRVIACEAKDKYLQSVFMDPTRDIHGEVSDDLYGKGKWTKEDRVRAKAYVFGSAYGREAYSIAQEFKIPTHEAEAGQRAFFAKIPDTMKWREGIHHHVFKEGGILQNHFGRKRRFWLITKENKMNVSKEALAFMPQSTSSDICLFALDRIRKHFGWSANSPKVIITVHDSIVVECATEDKYEVGADMSRIMEETARDLYSDFVPFTADAEYGPSWGEIDEQG